MDEIEELKKNKQKSIKLENCFDSALQQLQDLPLTRELAIARTKVEEAGMWLEKYQRSVILELTRKLCI